MSITKSSPNPLNQQEFLIEKATNKDAKSILQFLNEDFLRNEPLTAALGIQIDEANNFFEVRNSSNNIIGVRLASIIHRPGECIPLKSFSFYSKDQKTWGMRPIQKLLHHLESKIWLLVPENIHTLLSWLVLSVHSEYTRRGIAARLINHNLQEIRAFGCQGLITEATAFNSQQLFQRNGYQRLYAIELDKWKDSEDKVIFKCKDNTTLATLEFLAL